MPEDHINAAWYVVGGGYGQTDVATAAVYDIGLDRWRCIAPLTRGRYSSGLGNIGGVLTLFGGSGSTSITEFTGTRYKELFSSRK